MKGCVRADGVGEALKNIRELVTVQGLAAIIQEVLISLGRADITQAPMKLRDYT